MEGGTMIIEAVVSVLEVDLLITETEVLVIVVESGVVSHTAGLDHVPLVPAHVPEIGIVTVVLHADHDPILIPLHLVMITEDPVTNKINRLMVQWILKMKENLLIELETILCISCFIFTNICILFVTKK